MPSPPEPRVAVVIPAFNGSSVLSECLDSVLAQTEESIEVVVVDDGSTDDTYRLASGFARTDSRVTVVRQANAGPSAARNRGAAETRAPLFAFFDADDLMPPGKISSQASLLESREDLGIVYSSMDEFEVREGERVPLGRRRDPQAPLHDRLLEGGLPCLPSSMMVRRSVFDSLDGFRDGWSVTEDWDFCVRAAVAGVRFEHAAGPPVLYRRHDAQRSADRRGYFDDCQRILDFVHAKLVEAGTRPPERTRLRAHWITLMRAAMADEGGRRQEARRLVLKSLRYGRRPGNVLEVLRLLLRPRLALTWAGLESPSRASDTSVRETTLPA